MSTAPAPPDSARDRTAGYLVVALAGIHVLTLLTSQLQAAVAIPYEHPARLAMDFTVSAIHHAVLIWLALRVPQPALRILAVTVFAVFFVDRVLADLGVFTFFVPWGGSGDSIYFPF